MVSSFSVWRSFSCSSSSRRASTSSVRFFRSSSLRSRVAVRLSSCSSFWSMRRSWRVTSARRSLISLSASDFSLKASSLASMMVSLRFCSADLMASLTMRLASLLGRADLGLGSALAVLPAQIKAERRSGNGNNYHHHQYDDGYHVIVTPRRSYFVNHEDRCPRALFQVVSLCQTSFYKTGTATPKSRTPPAKLHGGTAGALPPVVRAADAGGRQNGRQRPETLTKQCCGGWPACGPMPRQILSESGAPGAGGPLYTDFIVSVRPPIVKKLLQSVQAGLATHRPAEYDKCCNM